jgi:hypothetical protein
MFIGKDRHKGNYTSKGSRRRFLPITEISGASD